MCVSVLCFCSNILERTLYLIISDAYWLQPSDWQRKPDFVVSCCGKIRAF